MAYRTRKGRPVPMLVRPLYLDSNKRSRTFLWRTTTYRRSLPPRYKEAQRMDTTRRFLFIGLFFLGGWVSHAQANLAVCGVDLRGNPRCHRELKRLVAGCKEQPVICGRSYQYGPLPNLEEVTQRCDLWHRSHRRKWVTGMCGIPLYSAPRTFCGRKGMEVAISCIRNVRAKQPEIPMTRRDAPTPTSPLMRTPSPSMPSRSSHPTAPTVAPRESASDAAPSTHQEIGRAHV